MASNLKLDISCPVCSEIYKEPVILSCSHSFCEACLQQFWESKQLSECPVCKKRSSKDSFLPNQALKTICESLSGTFIQEKEGTHIVRKEPSRKLECCDSEHPLCLDSKETAAAFDSQIMVDKQDDVCAVQKLTGEQTLDQGVDIVLNIAITGETGAGKSSFVNAIMGLRDTDEGAAPTGVIETTMKPTMYCHPKMPNVKIWDLPGIGSEEIISKTYIRNVQFENYDFFIIVCATRFRENDIMLAKEIRKRRKNFYFVRSKIDLDVAGDKRKGLGEEKTLQRIRNDCQKNLLDCESPPVFLISSFYLDKFEFQELLSALETEVPKQRRYACSVPDRTLCTQTIGDKEAEVQAVLHESGESNVEQAHAKANKLIDQLYNITLNIAVTGVTGAGKSSFVNAIRGVHDADKEAAPTGVTETTMVPTEYAHPTMPNVKIWDLPGIGSPNFTTANYFKDVNFEKYDFFLILTFGRVREHDINLAREVRERKKNFYFIRSKIDQDVEAAARKRESEEHTLKVIRDDCKQKLKALGSPPIFLVSSYELEKFDFTDLVKALEKDLPENKRNALIQSLPVYSMEILDKKYKTFKNFTWALAVASGAIAAAPVPGLSLAADSAMVVGFFTKVYFSFGLDDRSLEKLSERVNKPIQVEIKTIPLVKALADKSVQGVIRLLSLLAVSEGVESALSFVPVVGSIAAAGLSFVTTLIALRRGLAVLYDAAKKVIQMAELDK